MIQNARTVSPSPSGGYKREAPEPQVTSSSSQMRSMREPYRSGVVTKRQRPAQERPAKR